MLLYVTPLQETGVYPQWHVPLSIKDNRCCSSGVCVDHPGKQQAEDYQQYLDSLYHVVALPQPLLSPRQPRKVAATKGEALQGHQWYDLLICPAQTPIQKVIKAENLSSGIFRGKHSNLFPAWICTLTCKQVDAMGLGSIGVALWLALWPTTMSTVVMVPQ